MSTGAGVMSYFGGNSFSQNLTVLPAPSVRGLSAQQTGGVDVCRLIVCALVQIAQLLGLLHNGRHQHLGQNLVAGKLGGEPAAALRGLPLSLIHI